MSSTPNPNPDANPMHIVCVRCGASKKAALERCEVCRYVPDTESAMVLSLVLSSVFSTALELKVRAEDIRAHRKWAPAPDTLARATAAYQRIQRANQEATTTKSCSVVTSSSPPEAVRGHEVARFFTSNSFVILGATPRDARAQIVALAEDRSLTEDADLIGKARAELTHPRGRLNAELSYLPGLSPRRAAECLGLLQANPGAVFELQSVPPLAHANLLATMFDRDLTGASVEEQSRRVWKFSDVVEHIDAESVRRDVNADRVAAGFSEITANEWIDTGLSERRNAYKQTVLAWLDRLPSTQMLQVMTDAVVGCTEAGATKVPPRLLEEVVSAFELSAKPALAKAEGLADQLIERIRAAAPQGEAVVAPFLDPLEKVLREWDRIAKPGQICANARGEDHEASQALFLKVRGVGVDLSNEHSLFSISAQLVKMLSAVFRYVRVATEKAAEDASAIQNLIDQKETATKNAAEFEKAITYAADVGTVFKTRLAISPAGVSWGGSTFPLDTVSRVRWGAVRHSYNGIPTGTTYHVAFGDRNRMEIVDLKSEQVYDKFVAALWRAVCVHLMLEAARLLKAGKALSYGDIVVADDGCEVTLHKFLGSERVKAPWSDLHVWSAGGSFVVGLKSNKKAYASASYKDGDNAHVIEAMIRAFFKEPKSQRLSDSFLD